MTPIQQSTYLPTSIVTNIWEDSIKSDADMVLRNVYKKNYGEVVEQIKHVVVIGKNNCLHLWENAEDQQLPFDWYMFVYAEDEIPMILPQDERLDEYDGAYEYCRIHQLNLEWTESPRIHNPSDYDYSETDSMSKDLELLRSRATIALQNFNNEIQKQDEVDAFYKKVCYKNTLIYIGLLRSCFTTLDTSLYNSTYQVTRKMYGEKAFDLLDTQICIEDDEDEEYRDSFFDILE